MNPASTDIGPKLTEIFRSVFELPDGADASGIRQLTEPKWDSLAHVSLVAAIESEFGFDMDTTDAMAITSFSAAELILRERLS